MRQAASELLRIVYLSVEPLVPGQGPHTHVRIVADGLSAAGLPTVLVAQEIAPGARKSMLFRLWLYTRLTLAALVQLMRSDIAYVRAHPAALLFSGIARIMGKPVVHEINGRTDDIGVTYGLPTWVTRMLRGAQNWQYGHAAALIAVTPGLAAWVVGVVGDDKRVHVVPNGADGTVFRPDAPGGPVIAQPYVVFFGGLVAWHGITTMLAATQSDSWPQGVLLVVVGEGAGGQAVAAAAASNRRVVAAGYLPRAAVAGLAARALAVLCPIEGHGARSAGGVAPLKLFEGMASGRPVIVTDLPFQGDLVRELDCGLVIPPADVGALATAIGAIVADSTRADAMGRNGRIAIETRFDWRYRVEDVAAVLRDCVAARRSGGRQ
ncbi:MAG: glycosyltransferase [Rhizobiales bacterium]|nr:glycosyltransferase [Hyphomicrobiales bacterium]